MIDTEKYDFRVVSPREPTEDSQGYPVPNNGPWTRAELADHVRKVAETVQAVKDETPHESNVTSVVVGGEGHGVIISYSVFLAGATPLALMEAGYFLTEFGGSRKSAENRVSVVPYEGDVAFQLPHPEMEIPSLE